jgi:hypothetical protein
VHTHAQDKGKKRVRNPRGALHTTAEALECGIVMGFATQFIYVPDDDDDDE